jgi:hypothetical protein
VSWLWLLLGCIGPSESEPASDSMPSQSISSPELPPPVRDTNRARGQMLRYGEVEGYRSRRTDFEGTIAFLVQGDPRDPAHQREADLLAEQPALVLLVSPSSDLLAAERYLLEMEGIVTIESRSLLQEETP